MPTCSFTIALSQYSEVACYTLYSQVLTFKTLVSSKEGPVRLLNFKVALFQPPHLCTSLPHPLLCFPGRPGLQRGVWLVIPEEEEDGDAAHVPHQEEAAWPVHGL